MTAKLAMNPSLKDDAAEGPPHSGRLKQFKVAIGSLDDEDLTVYAQYRPKELQVDQAIPWTKHTNKTNHGALQLEFSGAEGRAASLELFFDQSETAGGTVLPEIHALEELSRVRDPTSSLDEMKRPHHCVLVFGSIYPEKVFRCVIESLSTKYTMFSPSGDPIRATVSVKLKECHLANKQKKKKKTP
ncbi:MAG: hypothetical protein R3B48_29175 [Kofleriaceae bacterium]